MSLLSDPHHDGSPLYLGEQTPRLGGTTTVRVRTAAGAAPEKMWVRTTQDAEPTYHEMRVSTGSTREDQAISEDQATGENPAAGEDGAAGGEGPSGGSIWWEGTLPVRNPVTNYRFLLGYADGSQRWLTGVGVVEHDPADTFDFRVVTHPPAPDWSRAAVVYQIFPDRFARSAAADGRETPGWAIPVTWEDTVAYEGQDPATPLQLFGGDLDGVVEHLDHIAAVGADVVYLTPVFPGHSNHRYNATTFDRVDPLLGGDEAYARLSRAVHARGWRLLGDLTINHTGDTHEWFVQARSDPEAPTRDWYYFGEDGSYETWLGFETLPKLDHTSTEMRHAMIEGADSVVARWMREPYALDGWRIDVANMTGRLREIDVNHDSARAVRRTAESVRSDAWVVGEHNHDASHDIDGDGWHGTMNYAGFAWPVWSWLRSEDTEAWPFGRPLPVPRRPASLVVKSLVEWRARNGHRASAQSWNILGSHDTARLRTLVVDPALHRVAAGLQFTLPGTPMVYAGDEIGLEGVNGEDGRRPFPWAHRKRWDTETLATYGRLAALRHAHRALVDGGLRWAHIDDDALVYLREHPSGTLLVDARRAPGGPISLDAALLGLRSGEPLFSTAAADADVRLQAVDGEVVLPSADAPGLRVWRL